MRGKTLALLGSVLILVSMLTPVFTIKEGTFFTVLGAYETDLLISGFIGMFLLLAVLLKKEVPGKRFFPLMAFFAFIAVCIPVIIFLNTAKAVSSTNASITNVSTSFGAALPMCTLGALMAFIGFLKKVPGAVEPAKPAEASLPTAEPPAIP
jgi:hypothetical protein